MKIKRIFHAIISLAVVIAALMAVSCGENIVPTGTEYPSGTSSTVPTNSSENTKSTKGTEPTPTTSLQEPDEPIVWKNGIISIRNVQAFPIWQNGDIDMGSKILIREPVENRDYAYYYSKVDGEIYPFCFDPFCNHDSFSCIAYLVGRSTLNPDFTAAYVNDRLYFTYQKAIYSCSNIASDLRKEVVLEEYVDMFSDRPDYTQNMIGDGNSLFIDVVSKGGKRVWLRYDLSTKKINSIQENIDKQMDTETQESLVLGFFNGKVIYRIQDIPQSDPITFERKNITIYGTYMADYDFKNIEKVDFDCPNGMEDGNAVIDLNNKHRYTRFVTENSIIYEIIGDDGNDLYLFSKDTYDSVLIGEKMSKKLVPIYLRANFLYYVDGGTIYRYDMTEKVIKQVYKNDDYSIGYKIIYLDEESFLAVTGLYDVYIPLFNKYHPRVHVICGDIDDDGNFVNVRIVEELE